LHLTIIQTDNITYKKPTFYVHLPLGNISPYIKYGRGEIKSQYSKLASIQINKFSENVPMWKYIGYSLINSFDFTFSFNDMKLFSTKLINRVNMTKKKMIYGIFKIPSITSILRLLFGKEVIYKWIDILQLKIILSARCNNNKIESKLKKYNINIVKLYFNNINQSLTLHFIFGLYKHKKKNKSDRHIFAKMNLKCHKRMKINLNITKEIQLLKIVFAKIPILKGLLFKCRDMSLKEITICFSIPYIDGILKEHY